MLKKRTLIFWRMQDRGLGSHVITDSAEAEKFTVAEPHSMWVLVEEHSGGVLRGGRAPDIAWFYFVCVAAILRIGIQGCRNSDVCSFVCVVSLGPESPNGLVGLCSDGP